LGIESKFNIFKAAFDEEDIAYKKIDKSMHTDNLHDESSIREDLYRGLRNTVKGALNHYNHDVKIDAKRIKIVMDTFKNISGISINEATAIVTNLIQELTGNHSAEIATLGISRWIIELDSQNKRVNEIWINRFDEKSQKSNLIMKEARIRTEAEYREIVGDLEALYRLNSGNPIYEDCIRKINVIAEKYKNIQAVRKGIAKANKN
jgi:hypothetical protein